jgi:hypothetical protein
MTNVEKLPAKKPAKVFGRRMSIEEYFRDTKSKRNGFAMRLTLIKNSERLGRFLLIPALAYILLVMIGLYVSRVFQPRQWCSNNRMSECSPVRDGLRHLFTIGRAMLNRHLPAVRQLMRALRDEILLQNWG